MVDPVNFTNFHRTDSELEETILFCVLVAGKTALFIAKALEKILKDLGPGPPFCLLRNLTLAQLEELLFKYGIGCYRLKAQAVYALTHSNINLRTCSIEDLEEIIGIGPKTSRFFILHTRPDVELACLDTHILRYMRGLGYKVPKSTPTNRKLYKKIEKQFIELAKKNNEDIAQLDLNIWKKYYRKIKVKE